MGGGCVSSSRSASSHCLLAIWLDYLWSIYRTTTFAATDQLTLPFVSYLAAGRRAVRFLANPESRGYGLVVLLSIAALSTQAAYLAIARDRHSPWWRLAVPYALLMLVADRSLWEPGGINRFLLPLTVGFNVLLSKSSGAFWPWFAAGNLTLPTVHRVLTTGWVLLRAAARSARAVGRLASRPGRGRGSLRTRGGPHSLRSCGRPRRFAPR